MPHTNHILTEILGIRFQNFLVCEAMEHIRQTLKSKMDVNICFLNLDCVRQAQTDNDYRAILNGADFVLSDGVGLKILMKLVGTPLRDNCNGTDLSPQIIEECARQGLAVFLLGGKPFIAAQAAENLKESYPGLKIAGTHDGYFSNEDTIIDAINAAGTDVLFVGMGVPVQEKFIARNRSRIKARLCLGVGAFFDYTSKSIPRAPIWLRTIKLEWLWRIFVDPRRMFKRYIIDGLGFMLWAIVVILSRRFIR